MCSRGALLHTLEKLQRLRPEEKPCCLLSPLAFSRHNEVFSNPKDLVLDVSRQREGSFREVSERWKVFPFSHSSPRHLFKCKLCNNPYDNSVVFPRVLRKAQTNRNQDGSVEALVYSWQVKGQGKLLASEGLCWKQPLPVSVELSGLKAPCCAVLLRGAQSLMLGRDFHTYCGDRNVQEGKQSQR